MLHGVDASWSRPFKASLQQRLANPERTLSGDSRVHTVLCSDLWFSLTLAIGQRTDRPENRKSLDFFGQDVNIQLFHDP